MGKSEEQLAAKLWQDRLTLVAEVRLTWEDTTALLISFYSSATTLSRNTSLHTRLKRLAYTYTVP